VRPRVELLGLVIAAALAGCQDAPPAGQGMSLMAVQVGDAAGEARAAMARGDWPTAARLLRTALVRDPQSLELHYRLAISATHLDAHEEALREFQWVEQHAPPGSEEAGVARSWLVSARRDDRGPQAEAPRSAETWAATGGLSGQVMWAEPGGLPQPRNRQLLMLVGLPGTPTKGKRYRVRTDADGRYMFKDVVAGPYQLTDAIAGEPTWRQRVVVEPGRETVVDLSRSNGVASRDDFPQGGARSVGAPRASARVGSDGASR
jgi:hypothetical protein